MAVNQSRRLRAGLQGGHNKQHAIDVAFDPSLTGQVTTTSLCQGRRRRRVHANCDGQRFGRAVVSCSGRHGLLVGARTCADARARAGAALTVVIRPRTATAP